MKILKHHLSPSILVLLCLLVLGRLERACAEETPVRIGVLLALTGPYPMQCNAFREGLELAQDEINRTGGINGRKLELVVEDTINEAKNALTAAKKLIEQNHVQAAIMSSYPEYRTGGMEFERHKIPVIAIWDSSPELDQMGEYIFGIGPWTPSSGEVAGQFAAKVLKAKKGVIITSIDPWADLVSDYFKDSFEKAGGVLLERYELNPDTNDFRSILGKAKMQSPDVIFAPIVDNIPVFHKQKIALGINVPVISSDVITQEHVDQVPAAFKNVFQTRNKEPDLKRNATLFEKYKQKFGRDVKMPWFITTAYDAVMILSKAIKESRSLSGEDISRQLYAIKDYPGATQDFSVSRAGSAPQMAVMYSVKPDGIQLVWEPHGDAHPARRAGPTTSHK